MPPPPCPRACRDRPPRRVPRARSPRRRGFHRCPCRRRTGRQPCGTPWPPGPLRRHGHRWNPRRRGDRARGTRRGGRSRQARGQGGGGMRLPIADSGRLRAHTGHLLRWHRRGLTWVLALHVLAAIAGLAGPWILGRMVDAVTNGTTTSAIDRAALLLVGAVLARTVLIRYAQQSAMVLGESVFAELREDFIATVTHLPLSTVERAGTGDLIARTTNDVDRAAHTVRFGVPRILVSAATILLTLVAAFAADPAVALSFLLPLFAVVAWGAYLVGIGHTSVGVVTTVALYALQVMQPIGELIYWLDEIQVGATSLARIIGVADVPPDRTVGSRVPADEHVVARGVRYAYRPGHDVLHGIDLDLRVGERLAIVGPSGAGKSTLGRMLAGIHPPTGGAVRVGGVPLVDLPLEDLRGHVALVTQEQHVFVGTLAENLRLARREADDAELRRALQAVNAWEWVGALPDGLATGVGSGGVPLSPAQAQQVALARLVLLDPHTLVLDEATSLLDPRAARHPVGVVRGLQPVRDGDHRAPGQDHGQRALQVPGGPRVQQRGGLVEHQGVRVEQHQPGQRDLLGLCGAQGHPTGADTGRQPVRQCPDPLPGVHRLQGAAQLGVVGFPAGQAQVLRECPDEDVLLLGDQRDVPAQVLQRQVHQRDATHPDRTAGRRVDAGQHPTEGRLAGAGRSDDGEALADPQVEVDPVQDVVARPVGVPHPAGDDVLVRRDAAAHGPVRRHVGDPDDPREGRRADLDLVQPVDELTYRLHHLQGVQGDGRHDADRGVPDPHQVRTPGHHRDQRQQERQVDPGEEHAPQPQGVPLGRERLGEVGIHPGATTWPQAEGVDGPRTLDRLGDGAVERRVGGGLAQVPGRRPVQVPPGDGRVP